MSKDNVSMSISHAKQAMAGEKVHLQVTIANNGSKTRRNANVYFNVISPEEEMWWVVNRSPPVPVKEVPGEGEGILLIIGDLVAGQTFILRLSVKAPTAAAGRSYTVTIGFQSEGEPRHILYAGEVALVNPYPRKPIARI